MFSITRLQNIKRQSFAYSVLRDHMLMVPFWIDLLIHSRGFKLRLISADNSANAEGLRIGDELGGAKHRDCQPIGACLLEGSLLGSELGRSPYVLDLDTQGARAISTCKSKISGAAIWTESGTEQVRTPKEDALVAIIFFKHRKLEIRARQVLRHIEGVIPGGRQGVTEHPGSKQGLAARTAHAVGVGRLLGIPELEVLRLQHEDPKPDGALHLQGSQLLLADLLGAQVLDLELQQASATLPQQLEIGVQALREEMVPQQLHRAQKVPVQLLGLIHVVDPELQWFAGSVLHLLLVVPEGVGGVRHHWGSKQSCRAVPKLANAVGVVTLHLSRVPQGLHLANSDPQAALLPPQLS
mmetsp:Transcript_124624/g.295739  ORF Transcript_124624/g.295739 Transcript_124624/m.295739 type:complete len:354 (+) Transcript_124624:1458-2519(+)